LPTNRRAATYPAGRRRAAATFVLTRPHDEQRRQALTYLLDGVGLSDHQLEALVEATGPTPKRDYGYTYSDLYQRLVPAAVLMAYPDKPVSAELVLEAALTIEPTPPFADEAA
jgi:hypothetical protein